MRFGKGTVLAIVAALIILSGMVWYLGRGGVQSDRNISGEQEEQGAPAEQ